MLFNMSSIKDSLGNCNPSQTYPFLSFPNYTLTDNLGHHPQIKNLQNIFLDVYKEVLNYINRHYTNLLKSPFWNDSTIKI